MNRRLNVVNDEKNNYKKRKQMTQHEKKRIKIGGWIKRRNRTMRKTN